MSKGSLFWGNAKGKLGETVFYRSGGEQRNRTYVKNVKNPKTLAQMTNRLSMANFSAVYRALAPIIKESFPNRPSNQSGFNAFMQANKTVESAVIGNTAASNGLSVPVNMLVSKGSLGLNTDLQYVDGAGFVSAIAIPAASAGQITTAAALATALGINGSNPLVLPANVKVTIVTATYADDGFRLGFRQIETANAAGANASLPAANGFALAAIEHGGAIYLGISVDETAQPAKGEIMAALIISYTDANGKLQVTTSRVWSGDASDEYVTQYLKGGVAWQSVLEELGYNADGYLATNSQSVNTGSSNEDGGSDEGEATEPSVSALSIDSKSVSNGASLSLQPGTKNVVISGSGLADVSAAQIKLGSSSYNVTITAKTGTSVSGTVAIGSQDAYTSVKVMLDGAEAASFTVTGATIGESNPL